MWKNIVKYIAEHRREIDLDVPRPELWLDIQDQIPSRARTHWFTRAPYLKVAAVVLLTIGVSYLSFGPGSYLQSQHAEIQEATPAPEQVPAIAEVEEALPASEEQDKEFQEVETYYIMKVAKQEEDLSRYDLNAYEFSKQYLDDLAHVDQAYEELQEELTQEGLFEYRIKTMIQTYELKIRILEQLQQQIHKAQKHEASKQS